MQFSKAGKTGNVDFRTHFCFAGGLRCLLDCLCFYMVYPFQLRFSKKDKTSRNVPPDVPRITGNRIVLAIILLLASVQSSAKF
ncbi:hypothetical protein [Heyndrickxia coagulans]|nr:hypothetical protein [Heyndrickxia coagulans]MBF8419148.1 hypothetical protein [Heyndrickxia coagulans]